MTPAQLRQWLIQNSQPDQWWLSIDGVAEESPLSLSQIEQQLETTEYFRAQVLHFSNAKNPEWIHLEIFPTAEIAVKILSNAAATSKKENPASPLYVGFMITLGLALAGFVIFKMEGCKGRMHDRAAQQQQSHEEGANTATGEYTIRGDNFTGFSTLEDYGRAAELASDTEAFNRFLVAGVMTKRATLFKRGETVVLADSEGLLSSKVKLRRKGDTISYWTNTEAIR